MTWDELEELRDRLSYILERERAEDGFCPIEEGYYIQYRQAARRAVADIDPRPLPRPGPLPDTPGDL